MLSRFTTAFSRFRVLKTQNYFEHIYKMQPESETIQAQSLSSSSISALGIRTDTITELPSGIVRKEENDEDGQPMFSIHEGKAKILFQASSPEDVFYNPGIQKYH